MVFLFFYLYTIFVRSDHGNIRFSIACEVIRIFHYFALLVVPCLPHIPTFSTCPQHMDSIILLLNFHRTILFSQNISRVLMLCYVMPHLSVGQFKTGLHSHISSIFRLWVLLSCSVWYSFHLPLCFVSGRRDPLFFWSCF